MVFSDVQKRIVFLSGTAAVVWFFQLQPLLCARGGILKILTDAQVFKRTYALRASLKTFDNMQCYYRFECLT